MVESSYLNCLTLGIFDKLQIAAQLRGDPVVRANVCISGRERVLLLPAGLR